MNENDDDFTQLAQKMVQKIEQLRYRYPDTFVSLEQKQNSVKDCMSGIKQTLTSLSQKDEALMILYVIHQVHKLVDKTFTTNWES